MMRRAASAALSSPSRSAVFVAADQYTWLNDIVCVGSGYLVDGGIA